MIYIRLAAEIKGLIIMVEVKKVKGFDKYDRPFMEIKSDKFSTTFLISKEENGFIFFKISAKKGHVPKKLSGSYTTMKLAEKDLMDYIRTAKESKSVKTKKYGDEYEKRKNA